MQKQTVTRRQRPVSRLRQLALRLVIVVLVLLILWLLNKVNWVFSPLQQFFSIIGGPVVLAGVFYYLMNPLVDRLEKSKFHIHRPWTIIGLFAVILALVVLGVVLVVPLIQDQLTGLIKDWPHYWDSLINSTTAFWQNSDMKWLRDILNQYDTQLQKGLSGLLKNTASNTVGGLGSIVGSVTTVIVALVTFPFLLWYMLRDGHQFPEYVSRLLPQRLQKSFLTVLKEINDQVSNYIRGQLTVAFFVALMFYLGYLLIGLKFALTLGIVAGILNLIPYLGSFLAMVPAVVVGAFVSPWMLIQVLIVFAVEQTIEGRLISPLVLGSSLKIHPVTIIIVLLAAGKIFGVMGVIFGVPGYAVLKVIVSHLYQYWREHAQWFDEEDRHSSVLADENSANANRKQDVDE
ncbi:Membrane protein [Furfurilactobacillus rossiae]|uniref:AI-2E family transporter n=1 Tax=Furfurilactobacillus rossiae TaxID=231049 RepID=UPI0015C13729|nr:AI-2E family transporter [Furfurilactobacillus rossiae]MCF6165944.1 AI-2E family transporter [Furfurilactobacillus rossiae]QLE64511.1 Membrane protein [Furfurilactobacillus rossiae]